jgi:hypothetical protein
LGISKQRRKELRELNKQKWNNIQPTGTKICRNCETEKDVSEFNRNYANKDSLCSWCKQCQSETNKIRNEKVIHITVETKICSNCGQEKSTEEFYRTKNNEDGLHVWCKECDIIYAENYYDGNTDEVLDIHKEWRDNNPDKYKQSIKNYRQSEEGRLKDRLQHKRRKELMEQLPNTFTNEERNQCFKYFDYSCAYCGSKNKIQEDHFISIMNDGPYTKNNIIVACGFCNPSKGDSDFFEWYPKQSFYSKEREDKILSYLGIIK